MPRRTGPTPEGTHLRRASLGLLFACLLGLPAGASVAAEPGSRGSDLPEPRLPLAPLTATVSDGTLDVATPTLTPEDAILDAVDPFDALTRPDALRAFIAATAGVELPDLRPERSADSGDRVPQGPLPTPRPGDPSPPPEDPGETGTLSYPYPGGDLTGDGLDDVLVFEVSLPEELLVLRALRGWDGAELWEIPLAGEDAVGYPAGDLTGDGVAELLVWEFRLGEETYVEDCPRGGPSCMYRYDATFDWVVGVLDGRNGRSIWQNRYAGEDHARFESSSEEATPVGSSWKVEDHFDSTNYLVLPSLSGDHDGDALPDLILQSLDLRERYEAGGRSVAGTAEQWSGEYSLRTTNRAAVTRGRDGTVLGTRSAVETPGFTYLSPVANLIGGPAPDLLWEESIIPDERWDCVSIRGLEACPTQMDEDYSLDLELIDGNSLQPAWTARFDRLVDGFAAPLATDVSGDGKDDLLVYLETGGDMPFLTRLLSGVDGKQLWERPQSDEEQWTWDAAVGTGDVSGDGVADILFANFRRPLVGSPSARLVRVNGPTGATLFQTERPFRQLSRPYANSFTFRYISGTPDVDGDGVDEFLFGSFAVGYEDQPVTGQPIAEEIVSGWTIESGKAPTALHQLATEDLAYLTPAGDLNGDTRPDAFEWHLPLDWEGDHRIVAHTLAPATELWSRTFTSDEAWSLWLGGDHDGDPGEELIHARNDVTESATGSRRWSSAVASLKGATGLERWRRAAA